MRKTRLAVVLFALFITCSLPSRAAIDVFLDYTDFQARLDELTAQAGIANFNAGEVTSITNKIAGALNTIYSAFDVTFTGTSPGGSFETLRFGATTSVVGLYGLADRLDWRNQFLTDVARIYPSNFVFAVTNTSVRASQIDQLSRALGGTAAHELGHNLGLQHHDAYGNLQIIPSVYGNTMDIQNRHIMATGLSGLTEQQRRTDNRYFNTLELAKLEYGDQLTGSTPASILEQGAGHGSAATAQPLTFSSLPISGMDAFNVIGGISSGGELDYYSFYGGGGALFTVNVMGSNVFDNATYLADSFLRLYDTNGTTVLTTNDDIQFNGNVFNSSFTNSLDSIILNYVLPNPGTYYVRVERSPGGFGATTGSYELFGFIGVPEPSSMALLSLGLAGISAATRRWRRRC